MNSTDRQRRPEWLRARLNRRQRCVLTAYKRVSKRDDSCENPKYLRYMGILDLPTFLTLVAFAVGATIGSFLNVVIYRVPRDLSVNEPRRSFCPSCKYMIPFYHNIPLVSWLALGGKCKNCGGKISVRYWLVELLTAGLFVAAWYRFGWDYSAKPAPGVFSYPELVPVACLLLAGFIAATFIDIEHQIIPDSITKVGTLIGLALALALPAMAPVLMDCAITATGGLKAHLQSFGWSALGATVGFALLYAVVVLGKMAFGKKDLKLPEDAEWSVTQAKEDEEPVFAAGDSKMSWDELFFVGSECVQMHCQRVEVNGEAFEDVSVRLWCDRISIDGKETALEKVKEISGKIAGGIRYLREAMGFGDVKFMALVGAFLGWKAVLFTVLVGSVAGTAVALPAKLLGKGESAFSRIPFGPYLALGATVWLFFGPQLSDWYFGLIRNGVGG